MGFQMIARVSMDGVHPAPVVAGPGTPMTGALLLVPGPYSYNSEQGFYSMINCGYLGVYDCGPKIVAASGAACNVERVMEAMAWCTRYGRSDEEYTPAELRANRHSPAHRCAALRADHQLGA